MNRSNKNIRRSRKSNFSRRIRNNNNSYRFGGKLLRISSDPPVYKEAPWNPLTLVYGGPTQSDTIFLNSEITTAILAQMELTGTIEYRIRKVHVYDLEGHAVGLIPRSTVFPNRYHGEFTDLPGRNHFAKIGFQWPAADQAVPIVFDGNALFEVGFYDAGVPVDSNNASIYVYVWWRPTTLIPEPPSRRFTNHIRPFPCRAISQELENDNVNHLVNEELSSDDENHPINSFHYITDDDSVGDVASFEHLSLHDWGEN